MTVFISVQITFALISVIVIIQVLKLVNNLNLSLSDISLGGSTPLLDIYSWYYNSIYMPYTKKKGK